LFVLHLPLIEKIVLKNTEGRKAFDDIISNLTIILQFGIATVLAILVGVADTDYQAVISTLDLCNQLPGVCDPSAVSNFSTYVTI
jgi:hypothetical protein